jgi:hypothetical protein
MIAVVRLFFMLILLMSLFPPWRGRPGWVQHPEEHAGYAFVLAPPKDKIVAGDQNGWVEIRIDSGLLSAQCLIATSVAGMIVSCRRKGPPTVCSPLP